MPPASHKNDQIFLAFGMVRRPKVRGENFQIRMPMESEGCLRKTYSVGMQTTEKHLWSSLFRHKIIFIGLLSTEINADGFSVGSF